MKFSSGCIAVFGLLLGLVPALAIEPAFDTLIPYPRELAAGGEPVAVENS